MSARTLLVIGGTTGIGYMIGQRAVDRGDHVIITGRDAGRTAEAARGLGDGVRGLTLDLTEPDRIADALASVEHVDQIVLSAVYRDKNPVRSYNIADATRSVLIKLIGYTEVVHVLLDRIPESAGSAIILFGGFAKDRPSDGSTTVSSANGGIEGLARSLAAQVGPVRVNALHPGIVGDSPMWIDQPPGILDAYKARTPLGALPTMADICDAAEFLLRNRSMTGASIGVNGGMNVM